jgi:hypothetical protein
MEVLIVELANGAGDAGSIEASHEVDVRPSKRRMLREETLVQSSLERIITGMTEEVMEITGLGGALDHLFGEVLGMERHLEREGSSTG